MESVEKWCGTVGEMWKFAHVVGHLSTKSVVNSCEYRRVVKYRLVTDIQPIAVYYIG